MKIREIKIIVLRKKIRDKIYTQYLITIPREVAEEFYPVARVKYDKEKIIIERVKQ